MSFTCDQLVCYYCRHFTLIILTNLTFGIYTAIDLNVTVFSVTKSQLTNSLWNCLFYWRCQNISLIQNLCLCSTWFLLWLCTTKKKILAKKLFVCFLLSCKRTMKNSTLAKTHEILFVWLYGTGGTADKIELCLRCLGQDWNLPAVPAVP